DVLEADGLAGEFLANGPAQEAVVPVDTNFRDVRGVVADRHGFPDEGSKNGIDVTQGLEADTVAMHLARPDNGEQKQVELFQRHRHVRPEAASAPSRLRGLPGHAVRRVVVGLKYEMPKRSVELRQRQVRLCRWSLVSDVARQVRQAARVQSAKETLDSTSPAWLGHRGKNQPDLQLGTDLLDVVRGEIGTVIRIEHLRDAADCPAGFALAPNRVAQRQRGLQRARSAG